MANTNLSKIMKWKYFDFYNNMTFEKPLREGTDASDECKQFRRDFRNFLKKELAPYGWELVKRKPNYYDITEVVTDGTHYAYISIGDVRYEIGRNNLYDNILYRTMAHEKDWHGGPNRYTTIERLVEDVVNLYR